MLTYLRYSCKSPLRIHWSFHSAIESNADFGFGGAFKGAAKSEGGRQSCEGRERTKEGLDEGRRTTLNKWPQHRIIEAGRAGTGSTFTLR